MNNPTDNLNNLITIMYDSKHKPKTELAGITYTSIQMPMSDDCLDTIVGNEDFISLPITHHNGHYFPSRILSHHKTIGYALMSSEALDLLASDESLMGDYAPNGKVLLQGFIARSYSECA